jgi:hypothetical protein
LDHVLADGLGALLLLEFGLEADLYVVYFAEILGLGVLVGVDDCAVVLFELFELQEFLEFLFLFPFFHLFGFLGDVLVVAAVLLAVCLSFGVFLL